MQSQSILQPIGHSMKTFAVLSSDVLHILSGALLRSVKCKGNLGGKQKTEEKALLDCKSSFHAPLRKKQLFKHLEP